MNPSILLVLAGFLVGACTSTVQPPLPEIRDDQFLLTIEQVSTNVSTRLVHRLSNRSSVAVCVGGDQIAVDDQVGQRTTINDALCRMPLIVAPAGGSVGWSIPWPGISCWPDASTAILQKRPSLRCGADVKIQSRVTVFRLRKMSPQFGATEVASENLNVVSQPPRQNPGT